MNSVQTLSGLLAPYNLSKVAAEVGVSRNTVATWARGAGLPNTAALPKLAAVLRIDIGELARIVESDAGRRAVA